MRGAAPVWGFLAERIDCPDRGLAHRGRVGRALARRSRARRFEIVPNGVVIPPAHDAENREHRVVFIGRHDARKGLPVLLRAWPEIRRRTGARLRLIG